MDQPPPRVKLYGLFPTTHRRYIVQSVVEWLGLVALLAGWFWLWPHLERQLAPFELPPFIAFVRVVLRNVPWIVLALAVLKAAEMYLVLRAFRRKTATTPGSSTDGQTPLPPVPGTGPGREETHP